MISKLLLNIKDNLKQMQSTGQLSQLHLEVMNKWLNMSLHQQIEQHI